MYVISSFLSLFFSLSPLFSPALSLFLTPHSLTFFLTLFIYFISLSLISQSLSLFLSQYDFRNSFYHFLWALLPQEVRVSWQDYQAKTAQTMLPFNFWPVVILRLCHLADWGSTV
jgi:hypothetical protein